MMVTPPPLDGEISTLIKIAVREDLGSGDLTVQHAIPASARSAAKIVARRPGVVSGGFLLPAIIAEYDKTLKCEIVTADGHKAARGQAIARITGHSRGILSAERIMLNFIGHLSGIATATAKYVDAMSHLPHPPAICDTRKTTPGYRLLDKYAVRCGGGKNHRMGLYDGVMLKDNHLVALRAKLGHGLTLAQLTAHVRVATPAGVMVWLEVDTLEQLAEALPGGGADVILLDNFAPGRMKKAVAMRNKHGKTPLLEASGGITLETLLAVAESGVDRISVGALTHSSPALDVAMDFE